MRWTLVPRFLLVVLYAVSATATIGFTQVPDLMFTGTSNLIAWGGGDGTVSLVLSRPAMSSKSPTVCYHKPCDWLE